MSFNVRLFSVTVRTTASGTPAWTSASISSVTVTRDPTRPARCAIIHLIGNAPRIAPHTGGVQRTVPWNRFGFPTPAGGTTAPGTAPAPAVPGCGAVSAPSDAPAAAPADG